NGTSKGYHAERGSQMFIAYCVLPFIAYCVLRVIAYCAGYPIHALHRANRLHSPLHYSCLCVFAMPALRPTLPADIPEILRIQALCAARIEPERASDYANKLAIALECDFVVEDKAAAGLRAYVFALRRLLARREATDVDGLTVPAAAETGY